MSASRANTRGRKWSGASPSWTLTRRSPRAGLPPSSASKLQAAYLRGAGAFTRQGRGDIATHKLFVERGYSLLQPGGRLAYVIPSGIYSDLGTKELREMLFTAGRIEYLYNFSNERLFFPEVHHAFNFTLLGAQKGGTRTASGRRSGSTHEWRCTG